MDATRRGGGGAWRAFVRQLRSNNLREAAILYRELKAGGPSDAWSAILEQGAIATGQHKSGVDKGNCSFGPRRRDVASARARQTALALRGDGDHTRAMAAYTAVDAAGHCAGSVESVMKMASSIARATAAESRQSQRDVDAALTKFSDEHTVSWREDLMKCGANLAEASKSFVATPGPVHGVTSLVYDVHSSGEIASDLCSYAHSLGVHHSSLQQAMRAHWAHLHRPIDASRADESSESDSDNAHGSCWLLQTCVCDEEGQRVLQIRNRVLRAMKSYLPYSNQTWKRAALSHLGSSH